MKKVLSKIFSGGRRAPFWISLSFVAAGAAAVPLQEARVSQVIQDVRLLEAHAAPRPAVVNDKVIFGSAVRTGVESRTELTFNDLTITRLGANTIFSFTAGARQAELTQGAILLQVPPKAAPVRANTTAITVSVTGGTALLATGPPTKFMVLEGIGSIYPRGHPEKAVTVHGGEMVTAENGRISNPEKFDVKLVLETSPLILDFPPLANLPLILAVVDQQLAEQQLAGTTTQPLAKNLIDVFDVTDQSANANPAVVEVRSETPTPSPTITPAPTPTKFGTPSTIASPNPYLITSGTTITTDPSITTNGVTDYGKIYRGSTDDGAFSVWAFGSTSAVDTALDFDTHFNNAGHFPGAAFKFTSLVLAGNPTIDLSNGGVTNLALISVGDITSGLPGGTLTFSGLDALLLASQDGSINLGSEITFQDIPTLFFYARGTNGDLTLTSPIVGTTDLILYAGRNITFNAGTDLILGGDFSARTAAGNISIAEDGNIAVGGSLAASVNNNGGQIGTGGNISLTTGGDLTASGDAAFTVQNTAGTIANGGNITVITNGSISTGGEFSLLVENYNETANPAGHIGTGGNLSLTTGGNLTADFASIAINNRGGGMIDSGVSLTIDIAGAVTTMENGTDFLGNTASLSVALSTRYDDTAGNTTRSFIGGDATLNFHADAASIGGNLSVFLSDRGGTIDGNALLNFNVTHGVTVTGTDIPMFSTAADIELLNDSGVGVMSAGSPFGGTIHGDATLQVSATNLNVTAGSLFVAINNRNGGLIDSNATLSFNLAGNLTTQASAEFDIINDQNQSSNGMPGGSIGLAATLDISAANISIGTDFTARILNHRAATAPGPGAGSIGTDATLNISASSLMTGGILDVSIFNRDAGSGSGTGGSISGNAAINLNIASALSSGGAADFEILNESVVAGSPGGFIGGDATINVSAGTISTGGALDAQIFNYGGGHISGNAILDVTTGGDFSATGDLLARIFNGDNGNGSGGGAIDGDAMVNVSAANISTGGFFQLSIVNGNINTAEGTIGGDAAINLEAGNISAGSDGFFTTIHNETGTIGSAASININAVNISAMGDPANPSIFVARISNQDGGTIGSGANIAVNLTGDLTTQDLAIFSIRNDGGTIGSDATIDLTAGNITANSFVAQIDNTGGTISGAATVNMNVSGSASVTNDATVAIYGSDGAASAAININGGNYNAGTQFLTYIDGNGTITFNNASGHADVLKVGALGTNGVVNIGGGMLSADTTLKLYANGSNGELNFLSNVTLGGTAAKILAANTINILDGVVVTIGGATPAEVYTTNANYTGFGGNGTTTGTFAGAGANNPLPLNQAPPFGAPPPSSARRGNITGGTINVSNTAELLALLDGAVVGPDGRITISDSRNTTNLRNLSRINMNGLPRGERRILIQEMRDRSTMPVRGRRIL